jgi:hypothetical protein
MSVSKLRGLEYAALVWTCSMDMDMLHGYMCAWRPDLSADLPGHLTGPVATPHVVYDSLYHIFISVLMYTTRTTQITYPNPDSYHNLPIP